MPNDTQWQDLEGQIVPRAFSGGYVALSYLVSYVGAWTTLELFNRRTAGRGLYNWSLLFSSSISMGGVSIWCMHYISNQAIILGDGQSLMQIAYSPLFTAVSFFVPILVLLAAFTTLGSDDKVSLIRVTVGGTLAGLAICGMHFLGQAGISNYTSVYKIGNVVGSAIVAIVASIVALTVFFVLRATWTNSLWKRALCGSILAGAVFGMHWVASVGTQYRLRKIDPNTPHSHDMAGNTTVIVVIVLSIAACFILIVFTFLAQRRRSRSANKARQVVLACAIFDSNGRIMVTPEGLLPNEKITASYRELSHDDIFGTAHPVFHWLFRTTCHWPSVSGLISRMRQHLEYTSTLPRPSLEETLKNSEEKTPDAGTIVFREQFCVAAADLARQVDEPLAEMGILFDSIFNTGQVSKSRARKLMKSPPDLERDGRSIPMHGKGQLLFLVRRANRKAANKLTASGYRFADTQNIAPLVARSMQINCNDLNSHLLCMNEYANEMHMLQPGIHLACFALRARIRSGFEVLVRKDARNQLPTVQLPFDTLEDWMIEYLSQMDGWTVSACLKFLRGKEKPAEAPPEEQRFAAELHDTLVSMEVEFDTPHFAEARLVAKPVSAPCRGASDVEKPGQAILIAFRLIFPIQYQAQNQKLEFTPLSFFRIQQYVYKNSPDHAIFARKVHREFGPILNKQRSSEDDGTRSVRRIRSTKMMRTVNHMKGRASPDVRRQLGAWLPSSSRKNPSLDSTSEIKLVESHTFGGIMISKEVTVDVKDVGEGTSDIGSDDGMRGPELSDRKEMPHGQMGTRGRAMKEVEFPETYVDTLFGVCMEGR
ncbi:uncharacterized protein LY89DRAFT_591314 [Mollisia scopiformis]|uniref:MHYT domain-containing protein n=1 Tax=Mollisia scopiformis TaxID=149040 RepID=A0A194X0K0_MOLSC|nr:uncharacterized protein LY89DRAFT_591314 [Mollisia scopiformis]KUJ13484.1 hypothetical protein LY89DRAFT_591314 [Mollisia scopiformis]